MPRFFVEFIQGSQVTLTGADASHMSRSLRMQAGDKVTLCDTAGYDYCCVIDSISPEKAVLSVTEKHPNQSEPSVSVTLYQGLPKGEKMDWIVQKAVELGVSSVVPVRMERCVSRPDDRAAEKKAQRWQKIAEEAAKQCGRGILPQVSAPVSFQEALRQAASAQSFLFCYEGGGAPVSHVISRETKTISVFIGPEGGFSMGEVQAVQEAGASAVTLGPRILRTETAPLAALAVIMFATGNLE